MIKTKAWLFAIFALLGVVLLVILIGPALFASIAYPLPQKYQESLERWSLEYGLSPNFMAALIYTESTWKPNAQSSAGAVGLTQFIPSTARAVAQRLGVEPFTPSDLKSNADLAIRFGSYYISDAINRYGDKRLALIAYNGGGGAVNAYRRGFPVSGTVAYANKIIAVEGIYDRIYGRWWDRAELPDLSTGQQGAVGLIGSIPILDFWQNLLFTSADLPSEQDDTSASGEAQTGNQLDLNNLWRSFLPGN